MAIVNPAIRNVRKLTAAEGYLELDLPAMALESLQQIEEPGPLVVPCLYLAGESLKRLERYDEAIAPLRHAACSLPRPLREIAWRSLAECLKKSGRDASAQQSRATAEMLRGSVAQLSIPSSQQTGAGQSAHFAGVTLVAGAGDSVTISIQLAKGQLGSFGR